MSTTPEIRTDPVRDQRIERLVPLTAPQELFDELPLDDDRTAVCGGRAGAHAVLDGEDDRLLVVVGPCSVHDADAAWSTRGGSAVRATRARADLLIAMRVYFEKPRTTIGWKGLINDPHLDGSGDVNDGPADRPRGCCSRCSPLGLPIGCEFLDPITPQYISDLVCLGRDRRPHDREPDPPPARLRALDAGRLQERAPTATSRSRSTPSARRGAGHAFAGIDATGARRSSTPAATATATSSCAAAAAPNYDAEHVAAATALLAPRSCRDG